MAHRFSLAFGLTMLLCPAVLGQKELHITHYRETQGLGIWDILADQYGRIWLGTNNGLLRYDGYEFKKFSYDPNDTTSIKGSSISRLYEDRHGNIWISASDDRLYRFDPLSGLIRTYPYHQLIGKSSNDGYFFISSIFTDAGGRLLFGAASVAPLAASLLIYDEATDRINPFPIPDSADPGGIYLARADHAGNTLFMGLDNQLFYHRNGKSFARISPSSELQNLANQTGAGDFIFDQDNRLWLISDNGTLLVFDRLDAAPSKTYSFRHLLPNPSKLLRSSILKMDQNKNLWIGHDQGLVHFELENEKFEFLKLPKDNRGNNYEVSSLLLDSFNNLWIGTQNGLLKHEDKPVFLDYNAPGQDTSIAIRGYIGQPIQAGEGKILVPTFEYNNPIPVLNELDLLTNTIKKHHFENVFPKGTAFINFGWAGPDSLLFMTDHGVYRLNLEQKRAWKVSLKGVPNIHPGILQFYTDARGNEWLGTLNYLYKKTKGSEEYAPIDLSQQPGGDDRSNMVRLEDGKSKGLWLTTDNGLYLYDFSNDSITRHGYDKKSGDVFLAQNIYAAWQEDSSDMVWIGILQGGLNRYDSRNKKIRTYTVEDGLADMSVFAILHDAKNKALWLGTGEGISRFDMQSEKFTNFSTEDGLSSKRFYTALKTSDGRFFFGGETLIQFNPDEITVASVPPLLSFRDFKVSNRSLALGWGTRIEKGLFDNASLTLNHDENNITIEYLGVHYSNPAKNRYSYILENYDDRWLDVGSQQAAYFTNLPPGKYTFRVKAANSNGIWNEDGISLNIEILPPFWKTWWAYAFYLLGIAGLGSAANRYFKLRVLKRERERTQLKELEQARLIEMAYKELEASHQALKATQSQLIQSEKMASLGELTAGIAHEIQNPLNFVNNFAEINKELIDEIQELRKRSPEASGGESPPVPINFGRPGRTGNEQLETQLLLNIRENEEKILQHGQRADAIVKSMLQHSRISSGKKEPTDLNALADEYLRLAYHGLRAKDKSFNANLVTHFDSAVDNIQIIPQDIGRVLLNLYNNAFYAVGARMRTEGPERSLGTVAERMRTEGPERSLGTVGERMHTEGTEHRLGAERPETENERMQSDNGAYKPLVTVSTKRIGPIIEITVKDNGNGIPTLVKEKIFQPFFTTKPAGQGTGLGLSLAYDIIKAHHGDIRVESVENEFTMFIITLPAT